MKENELKRAILSWLTERDILAWRNNTGAISGRYKGKTRFFRFGCPGSGDIFALHRGVFCSIETKAPGNVPTDIQESFMATVRGEGGFAAWFDDLDDFVSWWTLSFPDELVWTPEGREEVMKK